MGVDVLKKLKGEARKRQRTTDERGSEKLAPKHKPGGQFFVSSNWKKLLGNRPEIAPRTASAVAVQAPDGGAAEGVVALDCEMVGVGPAGTRSALARVSIVDNEGRVLMDRFVRPTERVTDYRTKITGICAATLEKPGVLLEKVARQQAADLLQGKVVVGHSVHNDFEALFLSHPHVMIRDTALFRPLRPPGREKKTPSLVALAEHWLQIRDLHSGHHDSVEDARIALRLYRLKSKLWEKQLRCATVASAPSANLANVQPLATEDGDDEGEQVSREGEAISKSAVVTAPGVKKNKGKKARAREKRLAAAKELASRSKDAPNAVPDKVKSVAKNSRKRKKNS